MLQIASIIYYETIGWIMSSLTTTIEVSRRNRRRLDARRDAVREKTGKARVSLDDVITDLLDSAEVKEAGAPSFTFTPRTGMELITS